MDVIKLSGVSKKFRHTNATTLKGFLLRDLWRKRVEPEPFWALKDVSFSIKKGSTLGVIGQNGSGKSTMLKIIGKIYAPDAGRVDVTGKVSALIELGAGFHPELSGRENIYINGMLLGLTKKQIHRKIDEIIEFSELRDFIDEPVRIYSSGMYSRLGFSVAVNVDPDILLVDEVFAVGDESFIYKCKDKMDEFKRKGKTIVFVTHNLMTVEQWCDEVVWLEHGVTQAQGKANLVVPSYRKRVLAEENEKLSRQVEKKREKIQERIENEAADKEPEQPPAPDSQEMLQEKRWGNREVEFTDVKFTDSSNIEKTIFQSGESLKISVSYKAHKPVEDPNFGFAIIRSDGLWCYGTNTEIEKIRIDELKDEGSITVNIGNLCLLDGHYFLSVALQSKKGFFYDYHNQLYSIIVASEKKNPGIVLLEHDWKFSGNVSVAV